MFAVSTQPASAITEAKEKDLKALFEVMGINSFAKDMADTMVTSAITQEKQRYPNLPKDAEHALSKAIYEAVISHSSELDTMILPLYDKYYTHDDIKQLYVFFTSPVGQKYSAVVKPMAQDMMQVGQAWGKKIGPIAAKAAERELVKHGYK
jgi:hypothetical protein